MSAAIEELLNLYSDLYKDLTGCRPRHAYERLRSLTVEELAAEVDRVANDLQESMLRDAEEEKASEAAPSAGVGWKYVGRSNGLKLKKQRPIL